MRKCLLAVTGYPDLFTGQYEGRDKVHGRLNHKIFCSHNGCETFWRQLRFQYLWHCLPI